MRWTTDKLFYEPEVMARFGGGDGHGLGINGFPSIFLDSKNKFFMPPTQGSNNWVKKTLLLAGVLVLLLILAPVFVRITLNFAARRVVSPQFSLSRLGFNVFSGKARVGVSHSNSLGLKDYQVQWDWLPLIRRILRVPRVDVDGLTVNIDSFRDGTLQIEDIRYKPAERSVLVEEGKNGKPSKPITLQVGEVSLRNIQVSLLDHGTDMTYRLSLDRLDVHPNPSKKEPFVSLTVGTRLERVLEFSGSIVVEGLKVQIPRDPNSPTNPSTLASLLKGMAVEINGQYDVKDFYALLLPAKGGGIEEWALRLASLTTPRPTRLEVTSDGFRSPLRLMFAPVSLSVTGVDSTNPDVETRVFIDASPADGASIKLEGQGYPVRKPLSFNQSLLVKNFPLTALSPLTERFIQYRLPMGELDVDGETKIDKGLLDTQNKVGLHSLTLDRLQADEKDPLGSALGLPLGTAVALLKDGQGNIKLNIPVRANLNDPKFSPNEVVKKAVFQGVLSGIRAAITGSLSGLVRAGASVFSLDLPPVGFSAGQDVPLPAGLPILDKLGHLMGKRPDLKIHLGGMATALDVNSLRGAAPNATAISLDKLGDPEKKTVFDLATRRTEACRTYIIKTYGIAADRVLPAAPEYSSDPQEPKVKIYF